LAYQPIIVARKRAWSDVANDEAVDAHPVPVDVRKLPTVPGEVKPVPPASAGKVPAVRVVDPVENSALLAPAKVVSPVPP
jgi:hypothetical protein